MLKLYKAAKSLLETNRDFITIAEAINAEGDVIPLLAILKGSIVIH